MLTQVEFGWWKLLNSDVWKTCLGEGGCIHLKLWFGKCFKPICPLGLWQCYRRLCIKSPTQADSHSLKSVSNSEGFQVCFTAHVSHSIHHIWEWLWLKGQAKLIFFISLRGGWCFSQHSTGPRGTCIAQSAFSFQFLRIAFGNTCFT